MPIYSAILKVRGRIGLAIFAADSANTVVTHINEKFKGQDGFVPLTLSDVTLVATDLHDPKNITKRFSLN